MKTINTSSKEVLTFQILNFQPSLTSHSNVSNIGRRASPCPIYINDTNYAH